MHNFKPSAVTLDSCHKIINPSSPFILVIRKEEKLIEAPISILAEITIIPFATPVTREFSHELQGTAIKT